MREWLAKLMDCGYFDQVVLPKDKKEPESHVKPGGLAGKAGNDQRWTFTFKYCITMYLLVVHQIQCYVLELLLPYPNHVWIPFSISDLAVL